MTKQVIITKNMGGNLSYENKKTFGFCNHC